MTDLGCIKQLGLRSIWKMTSLPQGASQLRQKSPGGSKSKQKKLGNALK
jgi:hypothetical protein